MPLGFSVFFLQLTCVLCWVSEKCVVYDGNLHLGNLGKCQKSNLTADCRKVSNVALDLAAIPPDLEALCLQVVNDSVLHPYSLSKFHNLRYLNIFGVFSILPGAFKNLSNLQTLVFDSNYCLNLSLSSEVFVDIPKIRHISFHHCRLSATTIDVFKEIVNLETLAILECVDDISAILCRLPFIPVTLNELFIESNTLTIFRRPDCTFPNGTSFVVETFYRLQNVQLVFYKVNILDATVLKYFQNFSAILMPFHHFKVLKSEVFKVDNLGFVNSYMDLTDLEQACLLASELQTTCLMTTISVVKDNNLPNLEKCALLETFALNSQMLDKLINLTFINTLKNISNLFVKWAVLNSDNQEKDVLFVLCESQGDLVTAIKVVNLYTNLIKTISYRHFSCLTYLEELYWASSTIESIEDFTFNSTRLLQILDLSENRISKLTAYSFYGLSSLKILQLQYNKLVCIDASAFVHLTSLQSVFLGLFQYPTPESLMIYINLSAIFGRFPENLTTMHISSGARPMTLILGSGGRPKTNLSLHVQGETVTFLHCDSLLLESVVKLTAETNRLLCNQSFPSQYFKSLQHLNILANQKTAKMDLTGLNQLVHLKSLSLLNLDLSAQPGLHVIFHNLSRLEYLNLSLCWFHLLENDLSRDLQSLKTLVLDIEGPLSVMESFVEPLINLQYVIMVRFLLHCSCNNAWITEWIKSQQHIEIYLAGLPVEKVPCQDFDRTLFFSKHAEQHCFIDIGFLLFTCTSLGLLFFMLVVLVHQLAGDYLLAFLHIARTWVEEAMRTAKKRNYDFDVFVSYCGKDENWVMRELLPNLERRGPPFLRLCLHSRDFQPGKDIVENITDSIYRSRYTLCLVSRSYLQSNWCSLEMRLATYRLLVEHRDVLILVFLEKIPRQLLNVHHQMARLVKTRTYINWPQDPAQSCAFWDKLWAKLAPEATR